MDIKDSLRSSIYSKTRNLVSFGSYEEHVASMIKSGVFSAGRHQRSMPDRFSLTGWHTGPSSNIQEVFLSYLSTEDFYAWNTPYISGMCTPEHAHSCLELFYVADGSLKVHAAGRDLSLARGELLLIRPGVMHAEYLYSEESTVFTLGIDQSLFFDFRSRKGTGRDFLLSGGVQENAEQILCAVFTPKSNSGALFHILCSIFYEMKNRLPGGKHLIAGSVERILYLMGECCHMCAISEDPEDSRSGLFLEIQDYIRCHYADTSAAEISRIFYYNSDYLNRIFRKANGVSLSMFIQNVRLEEAFRLLSGTELPVSEIIRRTGYHNQGFFYRKFREKYGCLPGDIRRQ